MGKGVKILDWKRVDPSYMWRKSFYDDSEILGRVAQRGGRCATPANAQGKVGQSSEQPDLAEYIPGHFSAVALANS